MPSKKFIELDAGLRDLRNCLLPRTFSATGSYRPYVHKRTLSYRLLCHAEFEHYFEISGSEIALAALASFEKRGVASRTTLALLSFSGAHMEEPPEILIPKSAVDAKIWPEKIDVLIRFKKAVTSYKTTLIRNHGIKEENLLKILLPIGYDHSKLDPVALTEFNSFGAARGEVAHATSAKLLADPSSELTRVTDLLNHVTKVDSELVQFAAEHGLAL